MTIVRALPGAQAMSSGAAALFAIIILLLASSPAATQGVSTTTSETRSESTTTVTVNNGPTTFNGPSNLAPLGQLLNGPNGAATIDGLRRVLGNDAVQQTTTSSRTTIAGAQTLGAYTTFGLAVIPIGVGPGTINCSGRPNPPNGVGVWPVANCNFAGYSLLTVPGGNINVNINTHTEFLTTITNTTSLQVNLSERGIG